MHNFMHGGRVSLDGVSKKGNEPAYIYIRPIWLCAARLPECVVALRSQVSEARLYKREGEQAELWADVNRDNSDNPVEQARPLGTWQWGALLHCFRHIHGPGEGGCFGGSARGGSVITENVTEHDSPKNSRIGSVDSGRTTQKQELLFANVPVTANMLSSFTAVRVKTKKNALTLSFNFFIYTY